MTICIFKAAYFIAIGTSEILYIYPGYGSEEKARSYSECLNRKSNPRPFVCTECYWNVYQQLVARRFTLRRAT